MDLGGDLRAIAAKVSQLEVEQGQVREALHQARNQVKTLERRCQAVESENQELINKAKLASEESLRLQLDKQALIDTVKKLNRDVAKLEAFKKDLLQHLQEDEVGALNLAAVDLSSERLLNEVLTTSALKGGSYATTSYSSPASRAYQAIPSPSLSPSHHTSHYAASDSTSTPLNVDGKQFFSIARSKLSYEAFSSFLHNIKELNAGRQTKEMTLMRVREVFGQQHEQLYLTFEQLLNKAASSFGA